MFRSARLKLTAWYLLIIMAISIAFSAVIYYGATQEFDRILRMQRYRIEHPEYHVRIVPGLPWQIEKEPELPEPDPQVIAEAKLRVLESLIGVNLIILIFSTLAGYFLAGRTLKPIQEMVDEQNRFITDASHELNTPLTSLRTAIEVNLRKKDLTLPDAKNVLTSNLEEVENLQVLSDELIKLSKYQKPREAVLSEKIVLDEIILQAKEKVGTLAQNKEMQFALQVPQLKMVGDKKSLTDLFVILFDNAIKYSPKGKTVTVKAKQIDGHVSITVADKGRGIPAEDLPHIFDRFYRADKSRTKQEVPGYGLGLSIAKRVVTLHNGTIQAASTVGKGSTFTIMLPLAAV